MTKKTYLLLLLSITCSLAAMAQERYLVYFKDKDLSPHLCGQVSEKAQKRRAQAGIGTDWYDYVVNPSYLQEVAAKGKIIAVSKWLNACLVEAESGSVSALSCAEKVEKQHSGGAQQKFKMPVSSPLLKADSFSYGGNAQQATAMNIRCLHNAGFTGQGMSIAFLDAGYSGMDTIPFFQHLRDLSRISFTYDFWKDTSDVYTKSDHGTMVAGYVLSRSQGTYMGLAPDVSSVMLFTTDDYFTETYQDEFFYVRALEMADSMGADVVSASLSYRDFDPGTPDYGLPQFDGKTAISTKGVNIAVSKGLLVVGGAGNSGSICAPCDAPNIVCVGGAYNTSSYDEISSRGPTGDGRIKPDVVAVTRDIIHIAGHGGLLYSFYGGTSSATPQVAALALLLKQAHPERSNMEIIRAIKLSGKNAASPNNSTGHGIPDACKADSILNTVSGMDVPGHNGHEVQLYPNPAGDMCTIIAEGKKISAIEVMNLSGQAVIRETGMAVSAFNCYTGSLGGGIYYVKITLTDGSYLLKKMIRADR